MIKPDGRCFLLRKELPDPSVERECPLCSCTLAQLATGSGCTQADTPNRGAKGILQAEAARVRAVENATKILARADEILAAEKVLADAEEAEAIAYKKALAGFDRACGRAAPGTALPSPAEWGLEANDPKVAKVVKHYRPGRIFNL